MPGVRRCVFIRRMGGCARAPAPGQGPRQPRTATGTRGEEPPVRWVFLHGLEVKAALAVAGALPWFDGLCGFALGLFLRNEVAAQQRQQSLCEGGGAAFFGAAILFGGLALELDGELDERDAALAELVRIGLGNLFFALMHGGEQRLGKAAARPDGGNGFVWLGVLIVVAQGIVGGVEDRAGSGEMRRSVRGPRRVGAVVVWLVCHAGGDCFVVTHAVLLDLLSGCKKRTGRRVRRRPVRGGKVSIFRLAILGEITGRRKASRQLPVVSPQFSVVRVWCRRCHLSEARRGATGLRLNCEMQVPPLRSLRSLRSG